MRCNIEAVEEAKFDFEDLQDAKIARLACQAARPAARPAAGLATLRVVEDFLDQNFMNSHFEVVQDANSDFEAVYDAKR